MDHINLTHHLLIEVNVSVNLRRGRTISPRYVRVDRSIPDSASVGDLRCLLRIEWIGAHWLDCGGGIQHALHETM
jgi:hypothetical protein